MSDRLTDKSVRGISMSALKIIACISMLIDHISLCFIPQFNAAGEPSVLYLLGRCLGRPSFIIFCFALVEAFYHTRSRKKHLLLLVLFAIISEAPFDYMRCGQLFDLYFLKQNVLFTFSISFAAVWLLDYVHEKCFDKIKAEYYFYSVIIIVSACVISILICSDYSALGVLCVLIFYYTRFDKKATVIAMVIWGVVAALLNYDIEPFGLIALWPVLWLYNGERGRSPKLFFYIFFPAHFVILTILMLLLY